MPLRKKWRLWKGLSKDCLIPRSSGSLALAKAGATGNLAYWSSPDGKRHWLGVFEVHPSSETVFLLLNPRTTTGDLLPFIAGNRSWSQFSLNGLLISGWRFESSPVHR